MIYEENGKNQYGIFFMGNGTILAIELKWGKFHRRNGPKFEYKVFPHQTGGPSINHVNMSR
jgi:hypothetical protein